MRGGLQMSLDLGQPPRTARRRAVQARPEEADVYEAVAGLRGAGLAVYRNGALHLVDGKLLTTAQLLQLHRAEMRRRRGETEE